MDLEKKAEPTTNVATWLNNISDYDKQFSEWLARTKRIIDRYKDERSTTSGQSDSCRYNILWSNVQTLMPAVYARLPKPDVSRRFSDNDPVGRVASLMLERALEFEIEHYPDYRAAMKNSVFDRFMGGRGVSWVRYEPHFRAAQEGVPEDGVQITDNSDEAEAPQSPQEEMDYECCPVDYVHWRDFGHVVARTWEEVPAVWRKVYMTRPALIERFGDELGSKIPLDTMPEEVKKSTMSFGEGSYQACIYEIWDKASDKAIWLSKSMGKVLDERDDPLKLEAFWPCPRPLFATLTTDDLVPTPDYALYQDQARELDSLAERINGLIEALKVRGIYDAAVPELSRLFSEAGNNDLIPVKNWQAFSEKNGLKGAIDIVDIAPIASALNECYTAVEQVKNQVYEIAGISDIMRGANDPTETATATRTKGAFGSLRLKNLQGDVMQFATEILQIKAQIICSLFQPQTIVQISAASQMSVEDQQMIPAALQMLKSEPMRNFRIEVSSDSMVQMDEVQEKSDRMEFLTAVGGFMEKALPAAQETPELGQLMVELMKFGVTGFKVGKAIEGAFDQALDQLKKAATNPQQRPNPEMQKLQMQAQLQEQAQQHKIQADQQSEQFRQQAAQQQMQMDAQARQHQAQLDAQVEQHKQQVQAQQVQQQNALEAQREQQRQQNDAAMEQMRIASDNALKRSQQQLELLITRLNNANKIEVAEVKASADLQLAQMQAANEAAQNDVDRQIVDSAPQRMERPPEQPQGPQQ